LQAGRRQFFSNAKARDELGWQPQVPLSQSVAEAVAWFGPAPELAISPAAPLESHVR
jgi:nucleoside-diphosphate-sugar epimerase